MNDTTEQMTAQIPSGLALPACGHDLGATSGLLAPSASTAKTTNAAWAMAAVSTTGTDVVSEHRGANVLGTIDKAFPGSPAWRPPIT